jgi:hypothetical protein
MPYVHTQYQSRTGGMEPELLLKRVVKYQCLSLLQHPIIGTERNCSEEAEFRIGRYDERSER